MSETEITWMISVGFDAFGDAIVALQFGDDAEPQILPVGAVDRLTVTLGAAAAAVRVRAAMYRNLSLLGWTHEDAVQFVNKHCGSTLEQGPPGPE